MCVKHRHINTEHASAANFRKFGNLSCWASLHPCTASTLNTHRHTAHTCLDSVIADRRVLADFLDSPLRRETRRERQIRVECRGLTYILYKEIIKSINSTPKSL